MADDETPKPPGSPGGGRARLFLMVAGGLAAPMLALAAFFLSNAGQSPDPVRSKVTQAGQVKATTTPVPGNPVPGHPVPGPAVAAAPVTTTSTLPASTVPARPARDPFAPLVVQTPTGGTPPR